jgi:hypothetical protein
MVNGYFFFCSLCREEGDEETKKRLYESVKDELVPAHAHYRPGTRPWAWWEWDAPEPRLVIKRELDPDHDDADCEGRHTDDCYVVYYEDDYGYLARLRLLFPEEKKIFKKYGCVINVNIQPGERGKCARCWERAREIAKKIDFDLENASQRFEFWIPAALFLPCEHVTWNKGDEGIFWDAG